MTEKIMTTNGIVMNINTAYKYVVIEHANEYVDDADGFIITWRNPHCCNGEWQADSEIFPPTLGGIMRLTREAKALNSQIKREVEDNTFTFR